MKILFVHNFCTHYTKPVFEKLASLHDILFLFFTKGDDRFWLAEHGVKHGSFPHKYLRGYRVLGTVFSLQLVRELLVGRYDICIKCVNGKFAVAAAFGIAKLRGKPFVLYTGIWAPVRTGLHRFTAPLLHALYRNCDAIVVYGTHVRRALQAVGVGTEKIFVAPHAVDNSAYNRDVAIEEIVALRQAFGIEPNNRIVLYVGRFDPIKGLDYLLEAMSRLRGLNAVLVLAGTGESRDLLEQQAQDLGIESRVRFTGYVSPEQTVVWYAAATVAVLPSITMNSGRELWGLVVNEAMNQGTPVIATEAVGAAAGELLADQVNGRVVRERDSQALAAAIEQIVADPEARERMSRNARRIIAAWNQERMAEGFTEAIEYIGAKQGGTIGTHVQRHGTPTAAEADRLRRRPVQQL